MPTAPTARELLRRVAAGRALVPETVLDVLRRLQAASYEAFLAGGCVRDVLLGRTADDFDVATSARPEVVAKLFPRVIPTGLQHGTVTVISGDEKVEVTTYRGEGAYLDGRRPESVEFIDDIERDLARRDFTVNAIAWHPETGALRDPFGGVGDLARRRIRAVGAARARFDEDGLRALRAVRFASTLSFGLDAATRAAIPEAMETFRKVAKERVRDEVVKLLLRSPKPSKGLELLATTGLLAEFWPELLEGRGLRQNKWHRWDVWEHTLRVVDASAPALVVRLSAALHDVAKPRCAEEVTPGEHTFHKHELVGADLSAEMLERLKFPRRVIDAVVHQVREHNWFYTADWNDGTVRRHLARLGDDAFDDFFALREADLKGRGRNVASGLRNLAELRARFDVEREKKSALSVKDLAIGGDDVLALGVTGKAVGETLRRLLQHVLDHPDDNTRERLVALAGGREIT